VQPDKALAEAKKVVHATTLEEQRKALVNSNPKDIANLVLFGRATYKKMIQNLVGHRLQCHCATIGNRLHTGFSD